MIILLNCQRNSIIMCLAISKSTGPFSRHVLRTTRPPTFIYEEEFFSVWWRWVNGGSGRAEENMSVAWRNQGSENFWDKMTVSWRHFPHRCFSDAFWLQDYLVIFGRVQKDDFFSLFFPLNLCMFQHKRRFYAKKQLFSFYWILLGFDKQKNVDHGIFFLLFFKDKILSSRGPSLLLKICFHLSF